MGKKILIAVVVTLALMFLIAGVPLIINECYKAGGYVTLWNANDVLAYYGTILGATVAVVVLAITILFTRKQILHDQYLKNQVEQWKKVDEIVKQTMEAIEPLLVVQMVYSDLGYKEAGKTTGKLQRHLMKTKASMDMLGCHIDDSEYTRIEELIVDIFSCMNMVEEYTNQYVSQLMLIQRMNLRKNHEKVLNMAMQSPGLVDDKIIQESKRYLEENPSVSMDEISKEIGDISYKLVEIHNTTYQALLAKKRETFRRIEQENLSAANKMLKWFYRGER